MTWRTSRYKQMVIDLLKNNDTIVFHAGSGEAGPVYPSG